MDPKAREEAFTGSLTAKEREIVRILADANGEIVTKGRLLATLLGRSPRTLDTYVKQIRAKMRSAGLDGLSLKTHVGVGYTLDRNWRSLEAQTSAASKH